MTFQGSSQAKSSENEVPYCRMHSHCFAVFPSNHQLLNWFFFELAKEKILSKKYSSLCVFSCLMYIYERNLWRKKGSFFYNRCVCCSRRCQKRELRLKKYLAAKMSIYSCLVKSAAHFFSDPAIHWKGKFSKQYFQTDAKKKKTSTSFADGLPELFLDNGRLV